MFISGHDLPPAVLLPAFAVAAATGWLAGARRRGPLAIGTGLLTAQGALHFLYARAQADPAAPAGHHPGTGPAEAMGGLPAGAIGMLVVHIVGAVICALWLARGEEAFFRLARAVAALAFTPLRLLLASPDAPHAPRRPAVPRTTAPARSGAAALLGHTLVRRGPPPPSGIRATAPGAAV
ncbi:hypothetical protein FQU76_07670 [Streptomyces qinzhouensis]|uniref:Uncharacterized protein n=2 Tax=Streptomyces qinzhouensis TaxID=2599401 RepID=A0A5B8IQM7_9ACTN|nr:hypothetical protein FQU76_07670 [Streptomyces qinzhouensis]